MLREQKLFSVQQRPKKQRLHQKHQKVIIYLQYVLIFLICLFLLYIGLRNVTLKNFEAENAGLQGRKSLLKEDYSLSDDSVGSQYEQLLNSKLGKIDFESLAGICDLPPGVNPSLCRKKSVSDNQDLTDPSSIPQIIHTLGERHSGTNAATDLAHANFKLSLVSKSYIRRKFPWVKAAEFQREFGLNNHKHNIQGDYGYYPGLSIISIRNPFDWIRSMMRECYFCDNAQLIAIKKGINEFLTSPWTKGAHILPGEKYANIFDLRKKKFCNHLRVAYKRSDCVLVVRAEENILGQQQKHFVLKIANMTNWEIVDQTAKVFSTYLGRGSAQGSFNSSRYFSQSLLMHPELDPELVQAVGEIMDVRFEAALGYQ